MVLRIQYALLLFLNCQFLMGQHPALRNIGVNDGLLGSSNYYIANDPRGYIWMAGDQGLTRFDGKSLEHYITTQIVSPNSIICIDITKEGDVFFVSSDGMIGRIIDNVPVKLSVSDPLSAWIRNEGVSITSFKTDDNGDIHIGTSSNPVIVNADSEYSEFIFKSMPTETFACVYSLSNGKSVSSVYLSRPGKILSKGKRAEILMGVLDQGKFLTDIIDFTLIEGVNARLSSINLKSGKVLFSFMNAVFEYEDGNFQTLKDFSTTVLSIFEDTDRNVFISLSNGGGVWMFEHGDFSRNPSLLLPGQTVGCITQDFEGGLWMSSIDQGVFYIPNLHNIIYQNYSGLDATIADILVSDSLIYIASGDHRVYKLNPNGSVERSKPYATINNIGDVRLRLLDGKFYYLGSNTGEFDETSLTFFPHQGMHWNQVSVSAHDAAIFPGYGLIGLSFNRIFFVENGDWKRSIIIPVRGNCLHFMSENNELWIGSRDGLFAFNGIDVYEIFDQIFNGQSITSIVNSNSGKTYVTTKSSGLYTYDRGTWSHISTENGLSSDFCTDVYIDQIDQVWVSTKRGLSYFDENNPHSIEQLNRSNGLNSNETVGCARIDDKLYVITRQGLEIIDLLEIERNKSLAKINLEDIAMNGMKVSGSNTFSYDENNFIFDVRAVSYKELFVERYAYQLAGYDAEMIVTNNDKLEFKKLPPGHYDLFLADVDENGKPTTPELFYSFTIEAPFWIRWWFLLFAVGFFGLIIFWIVRWRVSFLNKKNREKSEIETLIAEHRMTALRAQMNPHFIFNSINSIQDFVLNNETQQAYDYLSKFAKLIRLVLNNSGENEISVEREVEWLKLYVSLEQLRFKNSFDFVLEMNDNMLENSDYKIPTMIIQPFVENAIWHGLMPMSQMRKGILKVNFHLNEEKLTIEIIDNGVGRKYAEEMHQNDIHVSMGMAIVHDKIEALAKLNQSKLHLKIIDVVENQKPAGTHVVITIE